MLPSGHTTANARPMTSDSGMEPNDRLSKDSGLLSPITNTCPAGTSTRRIVVTRHLAEGSLLDTSLSGR